MVRMAGGMMPRWTRHLLRAALCPAPLSSRLWLYPKLALCQRLALYLRRAPCPRRALYLKLALCQLSLPCQRFFVRWKSSVPRRLFSLMSCDSPHVPLSLVTSMPAPIKGPCVSCQFSAQFSALFHVLYHVQCHVLPFVSAAHARIRSAAMAGRHAATHCRCGDDGAHSTPPQIRAPHCKREKIRRRWRLSRRRANVAPSDK